IETRTALRNMREIAAVPGINVLLLGTNDLCADLGIFGQFDHPLVADAYADLVAACTEHGKFAGTAGIHDDALLLRYAGMGARFMLAGTDI
ncbi:aldolase/citrate lyase family protein, partial [Staphylococcus aureus]|uniref:aldolase/citrate lyase family protein n=1 Tax=Staphylococcus aureus TaxID=1280 RepID=UPI0038B2400C